MTAAKGKGAACPSCGKAASGNFCTHCGTALGGRFCNKCGNQLAASAGFCNKCGASASGSAKGGGGGGTRKTRIGGGASKQNRDPNATDESSNAPWWVAGIAMFGLILVVGWNMVQPAGPVAPVGGAPAAGAVNPNATGTTDITQMSPREAADRLFNRVMSTIEQGDTAGGMGFQPMAVQAYEMVGALDLDGMYHMALLQSLADPEAATVTALQILESEPNHILALGVLGDAAVAMGDEDAAAGYYQQLLDAYDAEEARQLVEYTGHAIPMQAHRTSAQAFLAGR